MLNCRAALTAVLALLSATSVVAATAEPGCATTSPAKRQALVELYTSEGCSSCPPADRWLSALASSSAGIVPLALHVTYWDYLGWKDPFAAAGYTERQRAYATLRNSRSVYTPQVVVAGADFPRWDGRTFRTAVERINQQPAGADLAIEARRDQAAALAFNVTASRASTGGRAAALYVAIFDDGLSTKVTRGENAGETLEHNRVVRKLIGPVRLDRDGAGAVKQMLLPADAHGDGVAAFVQTDDGEVLQAAACKLR